jgi:structural maintenance of chromosomes protein 6
MSESGCSKHYAGELDAEHEEELEATPPSKTRRHREEEEEEEQEEESGDDHQPSSTAPRRQNINAPGKPPEAGVIQHVYVENFMCHRKFGVSLCRNVNFITGQNGSGKSAILAAIQICLGAGARRTHRARNLKDLVRKDAGSTEQQAPSQALIRVTLLNAGSDAYKSELYGDTITVERTIALRGGYNGYKLLDYAGVEQSRSKKDLEAMLDQLNIQVENPVAVLDQEESKRFLLGKAEDKFKFFMKATELARVDVSFSAALDKIRELQDSKDKIASSLTSKKEQVRDLKKKYDEHRALDRLKVKLMSSQASYGWAYYQAVAAEYETAIETVEAYETRAQKRSEECSLLENAVNSPDDEEALRRAKVDEINREGETQAMLKNELEAQLRELLGPHKKLVRDQAALQKECKNAVRRLQVAKQRLQQARDQIVAQAGSALSDEAKRATLLRTTEETLAARKEEAQQLRQAASTALRKYEELEPHVQDGGANYDSEFGEKFQWSFLGDFRSACPSRVPNGATQFLWLVVFWLDGSCLFCCCWSSVLTLDPSLAPDR